MKRLITICLVCVLLTAAASQGAVSQGMVISFDENGNGDVNDNGEITPLEFGTAAPPIGHATLYYVLPLIAVNDGDVAVLETGSTSDISDVLRFINVFALEQVRVYVYSDLPEVGELPPYDLADTGIPSDLLMPVYVNEVGGEGYNYADYTAYSTTYHFISDVPEPATLVLLGTAGIWSFTRKKRSA